MNSDLDLIAARSLWNHTKDGYAALRLKRFSASKAVAKVLAGRSYEALPRWVKARLKADARAARSLTR